MVAQVLGRANEGKPGPEMGVFTVAAAAAAAVGGTLEWSWDHFTKPLWEPGSNTDCW